jgi:hypothetical protein
MSTELTVLDRAKIALRSTDHEPALVELAKQAADIIAIKNADGRTQVHGAYMVLKNRRTDIRRVGKEARDDATKFSKAVIAEEDRLVALIEPEETRLLKLREGWDTAVEAERREKVQAAQRRKDEIRAKLDELRAVPVNLVDAAPDRIANAIADMEAFEVVAAEFDDQLDAAHLARTDVLAKLRDMHATAVRRAEEAAQLAAERAALAKQRAEQQERERQAAAARAEQERKDHEAREAEEAQRREAQRKADEAMRAEREAHEKRMAEDRAAVARQTAELAAERQRIADEEAARLRAEEAVAAAKRRAAEEAAAAERRAQAERDAAERRAREAAETAVRNAAPAMLEALEHIAEYWNRDRNDEAMHNALWHIIETAEQAIALARQTEAQEEAA